MISEARMSSPPQFPFPRQASLRRRNLYQNNSFSCKIQKKLQLFLSRLMEAELRNIIFATNSSLDELRDAHELLKKHHARTLEKLATAEQRALDADAKREQAQAECREIYQEWSNQLSKQAEEFRTLESQMVPQHIVQMEKINLGNELRVKFEKEIASLHEKLDATQEEFNKVKKESQNFHILWESAVAETDLIKTRMAKNMNSLQEEVGLQRRYNLELENNNSQLIEKLQELESRIIALTVSEAHLRLAEKAARQDADDAIRANCQMEQSHLRTMKELQSQCVLIQAQLECHQAQVQEATSLREQALNNLKNSESKNKNYRIQILDLQQKLEELQSQYDAQKQSFQNDLLIAHKRLESIENETEAKFENQEKNKDSLRAAHEKREKELEMQYSNLPFKYSPVTHFYH